MYPDSKRWTLRINDLTLLLPSAEVGRMPDRFPLFTRGADP
jgi:hypothetical protein